MKKILEKCDQSDVTASGEEQLEHLNNVLYIIFMGKR